MSQDALTENSLYSFPPPSFFDDPLRREKIARAFPDLRCVLQEFREEQHIPAVAFGVVVDNELAFADAFGMRHVESNAPVAVDSVFRIASMTKSFVAMAILKLRDDKKLRLDQRVAKFIPEFKKLKYPTADSPALTIRHLLTMSAGFAEDNPWGDRQMAIAEDEFTTLLRAGIPFANAPGVTFEYSNYAYAILGRIITRVSGMAFQKYITKHILKPLGMNATVWDKTKVPAEKLAHGYRFEDDVWKPEPILPDGAFAAMAGLFTTIPDFARYMSFLLDAFPPRDDVETGPVKRAAAREMMQLARFEEMLERKTRNDETWRAVSGYGFGLAVWHWESIGYGVSHGGGLPGYGSYYYLMPHHGIGLVAFTNKTYSGVGKPFLPLLEILAQTGGVRPRTIAPATILIHAREIVQRWLEGDADAELLAHAADNFLLDHDIAHRRAELKTICDELGAFVQVGALEPLNALRGKWQIECERGTLQVFLTLAPTLPPKIQMVQLTAKKQEPPS